MSKSSIAFRGVLAASVLTSILVAVPVAAQTTPAAPPPAAPPPAAQPRANQPIAVMWMQRILRESAAGKSASQQIGELQTKYQTELSKRQEKVRAEEDELKRQQPVLAPEAFEERRRVYQRDASEYQQMLQDRNGELDLLEKKAFNEIKAALSTILKQYQPERGIVILLEGQNTISYDPSIDVTNDILQRLDKLLPSVKVSEGSAAKAGPAPAPAKKTQ